MGVKELRHAVLYNRPDVASLAHFGDFVPEYGALDVGLRPRQAAIGYGRSTYGKLRNRIYDPFPMRGSAAGGHRGYRHHPDDHLRDDTRLGYPSRRGHCGQE